MKTDYLSNFIQEYGKLRHERTKNCVRKGTICTKWIKCQHLDEEHVSTYLGQQFVWTLLQVYVEQSEKVISSISSLRYLLLEAQQMTGVSRSRC